MMNALFYLLMCSIKDTQGVYRSVIHGKEGECMDKFDKPEIL